MTASKNGLVEYEMFQKLMHGVPIEGVQYKSEPSYGVAPSGERYTIILIFSGVVEGLSNGTYYLGYYMKDTPYHPIKVQLYEVTSRNAEIDVWFSDKTSSILGLERNGRLLT